MPPKRTPTDSLSGQPDRLDAPRPTLRVESALPQGTLPNYSLSTVCPQCGAKTYRLACKVRCDRCGFMWDCSEI
ncbi:MAG: hypothetical protein IPK19_02930 [Chloroflexi bacterium]|nr:hypothetical protein [Chloroflexota bacterium]